METDRVEPDVADRPISYEQFGINFIREILDVGRVTTSIDQVLGDAISIGPIKAGPGRRFATITALGRFHPSSAEEITGTDELTFRVQIPITVDFSLDISSVDTHDFRAEVLVPITLEVTCEAPLTILWTITPPGEDEVGIEVATDKRRSVWLQRLSGLDAELRRFLTKVVANELTKPHVQRATRIDMYALINSTWPQIAANFLPVTAEDRQVPPGWTFS